jgi:hypothetical protein
MLTIIRRAVFPLLFILAGVAAIIYGAKFHFVPVLEDKQHDSTVMVPDIFSPDSSPFPGMDEPGGPPKFKKKTITVTSEESVAVAEPDLIHDATIGGIAPNAKGELKRTYSGKPPSLCPT